MMDDRDDLAARIASVEAELRALRTTVGALEAWATGQGARPAPAAPAPVAPAVPGREPDAAPGPGTAVVHAAATPPKPGLTPDQLLVRVMYGIGLLLLLVGGSIFLAAIAYLGPGVRTLLGIVTGLALLVVSFRFRSRSWRADGALALGAGLEYLSLWYAHATGIAPLAVCALAMFAVTALLYALAYVHRSERIALAGLAGGFLTPLLLATERPDLVGLNAYLIVLAGAALALAALRSFRYVEFATIAAVALYGTQWAVTFDDAWRPSEALFAATCYLLEFAGALVYGARAGRSTLGKRVLLSLELFAFAAFLENLASGAALSDVIAFRTALLGFALATFVAGRVARLDTGVREIFSWWSMGTVLIALQSAVPSTVHAGSVAVEAGVLSALAAQLAGRDPATLLRIGSALGFVVAAVLAFAGLGRALADGRLPLAFANAPIVQFACVPLALAAALAFERQTREKGWRSVLRVALHASLAYGLALETYLIIAPAASVQLAVTIVLTLYATGLVIAGVRLARGLLRLLGALLFGLVVGKIFLVDLAGVDATIRIISFLGVGIVLVIVATWYGRTLAREAPPPEAGPS